MMGIAFISLFVAYNLVGWIGSYYEKMSPTQFWLLHSAIAAAGGILIMIFGRTLSRELESGAGQPMRPSAMTIEVET